MSTSKPLLPRTSTVRIPLDYYQILGVSFDATPEQIQQSYEDRLQQLPKQQYSAAAIASRKKLLLEAHSILLNPKRRQEHDQTLFPDIDAPYEEALGESQPPEVVDKSVDIDANFLAGALILLLEFGQFNAVLELGLAHLNRPIDLKKMPDEVGPVDDDVALAVSIANLELGREHWQQGECEAAGQCLQSGLKLLRDEGKFLEIQSEIETDLSKLRPYRVLDLLALEETDPKRDEGLSLLQDMLDERHGMEGNGDDQSGLSVNDFLLFMQQLRDNLTLDEQFNLFRAESMRPSSVATYLSVYAHVARGVSESNPSFISQAKSLLAGLADRQDLSLEQGMCSLLLGQPDAAVHCVQQSTDEEAIAFITDYSDGAPDIIPGLYLYTERWLQQEVYPYFRDLNGKTISLKTYFNDEGVQRQLSDLEPDLPNIDSDWDSSDVDAKWERWLSETTQDDSIDESSISTSSTLTSETPPPTAEDKQEEAQSKTTPNWFSALTSPKMETVDANSPVSEMDMADLKWSQDLSTTDIDDASLTNNRAQTPLSQKQTRTPSLVTKSVSRIKDPADVLESSSEDVQFENASTAVASSKKKPWAVWGASFLLGLAIVWGGLAIGRLFQASSSISEPPESPSNSTSVESGNSESDGGETPATEEPPATPNSDNTATASGELTKDAAQEIIRTWQKLKSGALGSSYQIEPLAQILVEPALSRWQYSGDISKSEGEYTTYQLNSLEILSVSMDSPTKALVRAKIDESRDQYKSGVSDPFASTDNDVYQVDYRLESVDGKWRIQEMNLLDESGQ